jgi:hypothetical protein
MFELTTIVDWELEGIWLGLRILRLAAVMKLICCFFLVFLPSYKYK